MLLSQKKTSDQNMNFDNVKSTSAASDESSKTSVENGTSATSAVVETVISSLNNMSSV